MGPVLGAVEGFPKTGACVTEAVAVDLGGEEDEDGVPAAEEHPDMQPAPQYSTVSPHQPYWEQHVPL